jgi:adenosylmethionine-8-amino-7-oxononanoate aminotransferase
MLPLPAAMNAHDELVEEAYARGLIIYSRRTRGGLEGDHFMVCPPLIVTDAQLDDILALLGDSLDALAARFGLDVQAVA